MGKCRQNVSSTNGSRETPPRHEPFPPSIPASGSVRLPARAQTYPTRSVRKIVPFPAGGSTDVLARLMVSGSPYAFFNFTRDTVPVAGVMNRFHVMVVRH